MMNELINELFGQALDEAVPETWTTLDNAQVLRLKEKFAELIVRECLNNMENCYGDLDFAIWKTKKYFGVEE
jgi:hypothetical protein